MTLQTSSLTSVATAWISGQEPRDAETSLLSLQRGSGAETEAASEEPIQFHAVKSAQFKRQKSNSSAISSSSSSTTSVVSMSSLEMYVSSSSSERTNVKAEGDQDQHQQHRQKELSSSILHPAILMIPSLPISPGLPLSPPDPPPPPEVLPIVETQTNASPSTQARRRWGHEPITIRIKDMDVTLSPQEASSLVRQTQNALDMLQKSSRSPAKSGSKRRRSTSASVLGESETVPEELQFDIPLAEKDGDTSAAGGSSSSPCSSCEETSDAEVNATLSERFTQNFPKDEPPRTPKHGHPHVYRPKSHLTDDGEPPTTPTVGVKNELEVPFLDLASPATVEANNTLRVPSLSTPPSSHHHHRHHHHHHHHHKRTPSPSDPATPTASTSLHHKHHIHHRTPKHGSPHIYRPQSHTPSFASTVSSPNVYAASENHDKIVLEPQVLCQTTSDPLSSSAPLASTSAGLILSGAAPSSDFSATLSSPLTVPSYSASPSCSPVHSKPSSLTEAPSDVLPSLPRTRSFTRAASLSLSSGDPVLESDTTDDKMRTPPPKVYRPDKTREPSD